MKKLLRFALMFILIFALVMLTESVILPALFGGETPAATEPAAAAAQSPERPPDAPAVDEDGEYTEKDELALYIHLYGHLPGNFVTKAEAEAEGLLPKASGRVWTECDVGDRRKTRGPERIVFSNDGLVYYTADHYDSFELLYGEP